MRWDDLQRYKRKDLYEVFYGFFVSPEDMKNALHEFQMAFEDDLED